MALSYATFFVQMKKHYLIKVCSVVLLVTYSHISNACKPKTDNQIFNSTTLYESFDGDISSLLVCLKKKQKKVVVGHRGGIAPGFPENSKASIKRVIETVPLILEIDVMLTKDGVAIIHHDKYLERTTNGKGIPTESTWQYIQSLKLKDQSNRVLDMSILRFDEFLDLFSQKAFLMLDMKVSEKEQVIVEQLEAHNMFSATIFIAYSVEQAMRIWSVNKDAFIALGAANVVLLENHYKNKFNPNKIVSLNGDVLSFAESQVASQYYMVAGSYVGNNPLDAQLESGSSLSVFKEIAKSDISMIVSNQPIRLHYALVHNKIDVGSLIEE